MRILHTADWHVGKTLRGRPRLDEEHRPVLADLVRAADEEDVDLVLVAGDVFDTSAPTPEALGIVTETLLQLRGQGRQVVVEAGNHDNARLLDVFRPVLGEVGITVVGTPRRASDGGALEVRTRSGELARIAVLPFVSQRLALSAAQVVTRTEADNNRAYADNVGEMVQALTEGFDKPGAVNLMLTHATLRGGTVGGGERDSQLWQYELPTDMFPAHLHYGALGHLHRRQSIPGKAPLHYSGSPLQIDFGEGENTSVAVIVEVTEDTPARTRDRELKGGRRLRTVHGTMSELERLEVEETDWLRVFVREPRRLGLNEEVRELLPGALDVKIDPEFETRATRRSAGDGTVGRSPSELFGDYLTSLQRGDTEVLQQRFAALLDEVQGG